MEADRDFPYYDGRPVEISPAGWLIIVAAVVLAVAQLIYLPLPDFPLNFIPALLFTGLPLAALAFAARGDLTALFRPFGLKAFATGIGFALLTMVVTFLVGYLISQVLTTDANPAIEGLATASTVDLVLFLARTFIQLIGEELITILPLLAVLWLCVRKLNMSRRAGLLTGVFVSTLWFAAIHLPTYNWNILQCLSTIGTARVILTLAYLVTRNLWVSSVAHIANDWSLFLLSFAGGHLPLGEAA